MEKKREKLGDLYPKIHGGKPGHKTVGIHFNPDQANDVLRLARHLLEGVEFGHGIDVTVHLHRQRADGTTQVTVTAPK